MKGTLFRPFAPHQSRLRVTGFPVIFLINKGTAGLWNIYWHWMAAAANAMRY
jgi:hypothetical protein